MNFVPEYQKKVQYKKDHPRRSIDGLLLEHNQSTRHISKHIRKKDKLSTKWRSFLGYCNRYWKYKKHSFRSKNLRGIDGVLMKPERLTISGKLAMLKKTLLHGAWRPVSVTSAFLIGVFSTGAVYHNLQASFAEGSVTQAQVAGAKTTNDSDSFRAVIDEQFLTDEDIANFTELIADSKEKKVFEAKIRSMVKGYPIEAMVPDILEQDRLVAAFLVSVAKKESNWGKRVPVLDGRDCYNYWGYRGIRDRMGTGSHTCFDSTHDAVTTVAKRIQTLTIEKQLNTPEKMIIWKCGNTCSGHSRESVLKWISDVEMYIDRLNQEDTVVKE